MTGAIVGGVFGSVLLIAAVAIAAVFAVWKREKIYRYVRTYMYMYDVHVYIDRQII